MDVRANPSAAPGELELVRRFVNTLDVETSSDELGAPSAASRWLAAVGHPSAVSGQELRRLVELREALRDVVSERGTDREAAAAAVVDRLAVGAPLAVRLSDEASIPLVSTSVGVKAFMGHVLAIVAASVVAGSWERLKACPNDRCRWVFYDNSRNRSRTWCSMDVCGARAKMRTYRSRRRASRSPAP
jgi:predicted RNA-binding Zn ribbon-like protein